MSEEPSIRNRSGFSRTASLLILFVVGIVGGVFLLGSRATKKLGPAAQDVIDFLGAPLPVPEGAKQVKVFGCGRGGGGGTVMWKNSIVLDVTGMQPQQVERIPDFYASHFEKRFSFGGGSLIGGDTVLAKLPGGDFVMAGDGGGSWGYHDSHSGKHFDLEIITKRLDFTPEPDSPGMFRRIRAKHPLDPVQGQRILWIRFSFKGRGLVGDGKWPDR